MPVRVINRTRTLLTVALNSGGSVHLAPDEASLPLDETEVDSNPWLDELRRRRWVDVEAEKARAQVKDQEARQEE